jgi:uncharacterized membrane protein
MMMDARTASPRLHLDAELRPHRSLTLRGALLLLLPLLFVNLVFASFFVALGAPLVPPFLGLDVLAVGLALFVSFRAGRRTERVRVTADMIQVVRERGGRPRTVWTSPTLFTRVDVLDPGKHAVSVRLACKGRILTLAAALGPAQREAFGLELKAAIRSARAERWS